MIENNPEIQLNRVANQLRDLGDSFYDVGNEKLSTKLYEFANVIEDNTKLLVDQHMNYINGRLKENQKDIGNLLVLALDNKRLKRQ